ncbi:3-oxoacyl-ACP reductase [Gracilaria domingensis]|nr:3-oxoacyl-ACP reductase [Gracilaria domingensis]
MSETLPQPLKSPTDLNGKTALVTGGHRGIGRDISILLAQAGADIIIIDRRGAEDSDVPTICSNLGRKYFSFRADIANAEELKRVGEQACKDGIDILVNNAGMSIVKPFEELTVDDWDTVMNVNLRSAFLLSQIAVRNENGMIARKEGVIVNISSVSTFVPLENHTTYACSKAGMNQLTTQMALELGKHNIRVNGVAPTVVLTDMGRIIWGGEKGQKLKSRIPLGRFVTQKNVANVVLFLASGQSDMVNGVTMRLDGGLV